MSSIYNYFFPTPPLVTVEINETYEMVQSRIEEEAEEQGKINAQKWLANMEQINSDEQPGLVQVKLKDKKITPIKETEESYLKITLREVGTTVVAFVVVALIHKAFSSVFWKKSPVADIAQDTALSIPSDASTFSALAVSEADFSHMWSE